MCPITPEALFGMLPDEMFHEISTYLPESEDVRAFQKVLFGMDIHALDHLIPILSRIDEYRPTDYRVARWATELEGKFIEAASRGDLPALQRLHGIIREDRGHVYLAFREAVAQNKLQAVQWLHLTYGMSPVHVRQECNHVFSSAVRRGSLLMMQWLHETFGLTAKDARCLQNEPLRLACGLGHLDTAKWLVSTFGLTAEDAKAVDNDAFRWAQTNRHKEVTEWMGATFGITAETVYGDI